MDKSKADQKSKANLPKNDKPVASNSNLPLAKDSNKNEKLSNSPNPPSKDFSKSSSSKEPNTKGNSKKKDEKPQKNHIKPEPQPAYLSYNVDVSEFHNKYDKFLAEDKENKNNQAKYLQEFFDHTGLNLAFKLICAEVISHNLDRDQVLEYSAKRLRELGAHSIKSPQQAVPNSSTTGSKTIDLKNKDLKSKDPSLSQIQPSNPTTASSKR